MLRGPAFRCSTCGVNWPSQYGSHKCPVCGDDTWRMNTGLPIEEQDAKARVEFANSRLRLDKERQERGARFDTYYVEREVVRLYKDLDEWTTPRGGEFVRANSPA